MIISKYIFSYIFFAILSISGSSLAAGYTIIDLGGTTANAVNSSGQVVGDEYIAISVLKAFLYSNDNKRNLGTLGDLMSSASDINDSGQIVGNVTTITEDTRAFLYSSGNMQLLGTLGGEWSNASSINNNGQIVGASATTGNVGYHAFLYESGRMQDLGTLGGTNSIATGINSNGQIVGYSQISGNSAYHAFLYSDGYMQDLGTLGGRDSYARSINDSGQIVGYSVIAAEENPPYHAFTYSNGVMQDLGFLNDGSYSAAFDINNSGQIVGWSNMPSEWDGGGGHALLFDNGKMIDLYVLSDAEALGWKTLDARGINELGQIVGWGYREDNPGDVAEMHAFLMSPVPEPNAYLLMLFGLSIMLLSIRPYQYGEAR
ncbi:DUF3466 family protein [Nitrosomonas oligotropha]|uniref:DUF3466 family protein n=1 Tax=Nitrosomonas oligotropha TaxID=42354 RepID=UPI0013699FC5|nr:DUF3466 family protein [Nitrosomonas oligotropha]